ncbi:hypothetical protein CVT24_012885 [Panaeolus cyanescens]|uniref:HNH nuclease domain-containing protein n=1 Tax=Panaeolus cyanescens TaxID=181874 RepID=A0A409W2T7_9AGAR|nr:hypothetical protein CVT24_012885 [Panaeolus cyanescens]
MAVYRTFNNIDKAAAKRAKDADPNSGRCLVENCSPNGAVMPFHVFNPEVASMDSLEWSWGMKRGTLNIDTYRNIFSLSASMYSLYQGRKWGLLPSEEDVYRLLPIQDLEEIFIARQSSPTGSRAVDVHEFPFEDFPIIRSHVHPKFVILHLGLTMHSGLDGDTRGALYDKYPYLWKVQHLSLSWTRKIPQGAFDDLGGLTYVLPRSEINNCTPSTPSECNDGTAHTPLRRIIPLPKRDHYRPLSSASTSSSSEAGASEEDWERAPQALSVNVDQITERTNSSVRGTQGCQEDEEITRPPTFVEPLKWTPDSITTWAKACDSLNRIG